MEEQDNVLPQNPNIDKLTLELFMNRNIYKKYVAKNEPEKYEKIVIHHESIRKYKHRILDLTQQLLEDPNIQITTEINEIFDAYSKTLIRHFQQKDMEKSNTNQDTIDDDVMFDPEVMEPIAEPAQVYNQSSFWGKERVVKSQTAISQYDMNMFQRKK
jgi:hypothetical protein